MLLKSASVPSLTATLASSLGAMASGEVHEWGTENGRNVRNVGARSPMPWSAMPRLIHGSLASQPLASHRLEHCDSSASRVSQEWDFDGERVPVPAFRRSKSEADLSRLMTQRFSEVDVAEPTLSSVSEEGGSDVQNVKRWGRRRSLSRSRSSVPVPGFNQERRNNRSAAGAIGTGRGYASGLMETEAWEEDGDSLLTLTEETCTTSFGGQPMVCNARGCRPLSDDEVEGAGSKDGRLLEVESGVDPQVTDAYYLKALVEDPGNALLLRNYAFFLSEIQKDYPRAEEYYERAILASPGDGEVLSQYAKLIYEVHGDIERATHYYEQAVKASPEDCYILASFASFLWSSESTISKVQAPRVDLCQEVCHPEAPGCLIPPVA